MPTIRKPYWLLVIAALLFFSSGILAQASLSDTAFQRTAKARILQLYRDSVNQNLRLYDGFEFTGGYRRSAGHPFFAFEEPRQGRILYEGTVYHNVLLSYDLTRDEVVTVNPVSGQNIKLITSKIEEFEIEGHVFVHLHHENGMVGFPGEGFYEVLYKGAVTVLAKRKKSLRESARPEELSKFSQSNVCFIKKDSTFYVVDSKRSLLQVCGVNKAEVARFMQKEKLDFKKEPEQTIVKVMDFYSLLKK